MSSLRLRKETALNLTLEGSVGSFNVGTGRPGQTSVEVKYFLTHVGLDFSLGANEQILSELAPVREIFNFEQLDFDEIMQRDIDDARVSGELIPYLLDAKSRDLVRLFPPIIVIVMPLRDDEYRPADKYPTVSKDRIEATSDDPEKEIVRAGELGHEIFQFEQPVVDGEKVNHDLVRLRLNTYKTRLVIVDGQHRAMALLALYRNLKDAWSDERRAPFQEYYAEWTPNYIQGFNLHEINLPVMFCTFPQLDTEYQGDMDVKKAARSIFLTLNKTARKVSNSRNILLDDTDLIAALLRRCLSEVKRRDVRSSSSLRIFNIELDQFEDRLRLQSPIALTGVNHVYYIVEHLLFNQGDHDVNGAKPRSGKFFKRKDLNLYPVMDRLDGRNLLGAELADATSRDTFTNDVAERLGPNFDSKFGKYIIKALEEFKPYKCHCQAVLDLEAQLERDKDRKLRPLLFEGQGMGRVFENHRRLLKEKLKEGTFESDVPEIKSLVDRLDSTAERIDSVLQDFRYNRVGNFLDQVTDKNVLRYNNQWHPKVISLFRDLYDNVFTSVAFEAALICSFYGELERANRGRRKEGFSPLSIESCFSEYLDQLNNFFVPTRSSHFKRLVRLFLGEFEGSMSDWRIAPSLHTFRAVVYRGEMQPDQWPKYKYLLLEIWRPGDETLAKLVLDERNKCRHQIFSSLYEEYRTSYAREHMKHEDALESEERKQIFNDSYSAFVGFLKIVGVGADDIPGKKEIRKAFDEYLEDADSIEESDELWESVEE